jgi:hypothetical protein
MWAGMSGRLPFFAKRHSGRGGGGRSVVECMPKPLPLCSTGSVVRALALTRHLLLGLGAVSFVPSEWRV